MSTTDKDIREQASYWAARLHESSDTLSAAERDEFEKFVADPRNERDFRGSNLIISMMPEIPAADRARWAEEYSAASDGRTQSRRQVLRWWAIAASLLTVLVLGGYYAQTRHMFGGEAYVTRKGEMRTVKFQDDSVAYLNTQTEVRWLGDANDRRVELTEGEALFDVVHDAAHPFRVMLGNSEIRVLGTRFNVYRKVNGDTTVTVLEGTVEVRGFGSGSAPEWTRTLNANDQIDYGALGLLHEPHATQAQESVRWRTGNYIFENQPVSTVLDELTRYTDQRIVIRDPRIADLRINGALNMHDDVRIALQKLQSMDSKIEVKENNNTFTLDYRAQPGRGKD